MDGLKAPVKQVCRHHLGKAHEGLDPLSDIHPLPIQINPKETHRRQPKILRHGMPKAFKSWYVLRSIQRAIDHITHACRHYEALHWLAEYSNISKTKLEFESCCKHRDLKLPPLQPTLLFLQQLLTSMDTESQTFCQKLWRYNNVFAFTSVNYTPDWWVKSKQGLLCFQIHGELYHLQGLLEAIDDSFWFA